MRALLTSILLCLTLAACGRFDTDQIRACRLAIPALNPSDTVITIEGTGAGPRADILRIAYRAQAPDAQPRRRTIDCVFAGEGTTLQRGALAGLASDGVPMTDASFLLLRRFYLEYKAEPPVDPGASPGADLVVLSPGLAYGLQQGLAALPSAAIYALLASAYALIYGLNGRILLTFGEFSALGALAAVVGVALTLSLAVSTPVSGLFIAFAVAIAVSALHGFAMGRFVLRHLDKSNGQQVLIATIGLAIALSEYLRLAQGAELRWLPPVFNEPLLLARAEQFIVTATPVSLAMAGARFQRRDLPHPLSRPLVLRPSLARGRRRRPHRLPLRHRPSRGARPSSDHRLRDLRRGRRYRHRDLWWHGLFRRVHARPQGAGRRRARRHRLGPRRLPGGLVIAAFEVLWSATMPLEQRDIAVYSLLAVTLILRPGGFFGDGALTPRQV
ncbi:hypothetical protein QO058_27000 [Bosea vestrisii]|nr:hypothetical protein [Bosea vestrisii]WID96331.1 hypothetical protein QO058_27000 [Bosea vestrisii]